MSRYIQEAPRPFSGFQYAVDTFPSQSVGQFRSADDLEWSNVGASSGLNPRTDNFDMNPAVTGSVYHDARGDLMNWRRVVQHQLQWDWMSTIVLPMQHVDSARALRWDVITYLPHMASPVPEETAPGLVTQIYSSSEAVMERIGMGLKEEHSAMNTVQGRQDTREKVKSVAVAVSKHIQVRGLYALLNCKTVYYQKQLQLGALGLSHGGPVRPMQYRDLLQREKDNFGAVQKEGKQGSLRLLQEARTIMGSYGVIPNTVIKTQMSDFYEGVTQMQKVAINFEGTNPGEKFRREIDVRTIVGVDMIKLVTTPVEIRSDWPAIDPLSRNRSNGTYVPQYDSDWCSMDHYESCDLTIERYDETHDAHQPLTLDLAIKVARRFDQTGALSREHQGLADDLNQGAPGMQPGVPMDDAAYFREQRRKVFGSDDGSLPAASASSAEDQEFGVDPRKLRDMFLYWTHVPGSQDGTYRVCSVIGDMEIPFLSHDQAEAAGRTFAQQMGFKDNATALANFQDLHALINEIDTAEPSTVYLEAVREANLGAIVPANARGFFANTDFAGTKANGTAADRILTGASFYRTLALPNGNDGGNNAIVGFPSMPFGYANYRGLRYLASFKGKPASATGRWDPKIFERAAAGMSAFDIMYARVRDATNSPYFWPEMNFTYNAQEFSSEIENSKNAYFDALIKTQGGAIWFVSEGKNNSNFGDLKNLPADDLPGTTWNVQYKASLDEMLALVGYGDRFDARSAAQLKNALTLIFDQIVKPLAGPYGLRPQALKAFTDANIKDKIIAHAEYSREEVNKLNYTHVREILQAALEKSREEPDQKVAPSLSGNSAWIITPLTHPVHSRYNYTGVADDRKVAFTDLNKIDVLTPDLTTNYPKTQYNQYNRPSGFLRTSAQTGSGTRNPLELPIFTGTLGVQQPTGAFAASDAEYTHAHMDEGDDFGSSSSFGLGLPTGSRVRSREDSGLVSLVPSAKRSRLTQTGARTRTGLNVGYDAYEPERRDLPFYGLDARDPRSSEVTDPQGTGFVAVGGSLFSSQNMRKRFAAAERISDPLVRLGTHLWLSTRITRQSFQDLVKHNIRVPFHMLYFAFNQRRKTHSWIVLRSGSETGISAWNNALWETGDDVRTQVRFATFTVYVACVVHNDTNVMVLRDIWMAQYLGGNGDTFCLDFGDYSAVGDHKADLIAVMEPPTRTSWDVDINLTGQHTLGAVPQELYARLGKHQPMHYSSAYYYRRIYGNFNPRMSNPMVDPFASSSERNNVICVRDYYRKFNRKTRQYEISDNQGHCGATYIGVARMRAGAPYAFPVLVTADNTRRQLEIVANN